MGDTGVVVEKGGGDMNCYVFLVVRISFRIHGLLHVLPWTHRCGIELPNSVPETFELGPSDVVIGTRLLGTVLWSRFFRAAYNIVLADSTGSGQHCRQKHRVSCT